MTDFADACVILRDALDQMTDVPADDQMTALISAALVVLVDSYPPEVRRKTAERFGVLLMRGVPHVSG
jgi:hypothetical protein